MAVLSFTKLNLWHFFLNYIFVFIWRINGIQSLNPLACEFHFHLKNDLTEFSSSECTRYFITISSHNIDINTAWNIVQLKYIKGIVMPTLKWGTFSARCFLLLTGKCHNHEKTEQLVLLTFENRNNSLKIFLIKFSSRNIAATCFKKNEKNSNWNCRYIKQWFQTAQYSERFFNGKLIGKGKYVKRTKNILINWNASLIRGRYQIQIKRLIFSPCLKIAFPRAQVFLTNFTAYRLGTGQFHTERNWRSKNNSERTLLLVYVLVHAMPER
jgi:hypothetical protein